MLRRERVIEGICGVGKVEDTLRLAADTGPDGISTVSVRKVAARLIPLCVLQLPVLPSLADRLLRVKTYIKLAIDAQTLVSESLSGTVVEVSMVE